MLRSIDPKSFIIGLVFAWLVLPFLLNLLSRKKAAA